MHHRATEKPQGRGAWDGPLSGIRVLAAEQMQALPYATQLLVSFGAEVVKVEQPDVGESGRSSRPAVTDTDGRTVGATYLRNNLGKRSMTLNLRSERGRQLFLDLARRFDVIAENLRPGTADKLGIGFDQVVQVQPTVVYVSVSGFGGSPDSPYRDWPAYSTTAEAMSGLYEANRVGDERPKVAVAGPLGDISCAVFAALGTFAGLRHREQTGKGQHIDVAMFDAVVAMQDMIPFMWSMGRRGSGTEGRRAAGILDSFRASDGFFVIHMIREHQFERLAKVVGHNEWVGDARFGDRTRWADHLESVLRPAIEHWAADKTKQEAVHELCAEGLAAAPSNTPQDVLDDPQLRAHRMLEEVDRPDGEPPFVVVGNPIRFRDVPSRPRGRWPSLGQDTDAILSEELGLHAEELEALREERVI